MMLEALLCLLACAVVFSRGMPAQQAPSCGYQSCAETKDDMLNVHLVPHSHDDVGWLKTVDQYYYGKLNNIQVAGVQYIIDSVVSELIKDPLKRYIQVETAFFWKWWQEQDDVMKDTYKELVNSGQIEMIGGGWSMNDEAATHYQSTIDNFSWGLRRLNDTLGQCGRPKVGWQVDPFGHSRETASIMARMGFDGLFLGRLDYQDKEHRLDSKTMEMMWRASANLGSDAHLFTGVNFNGYSHPNGFCFDINCSDDPIIEDEESPEFNLPYKLRTFTEQVKQQAESYTTNNVMLTMGGDFNYMEAHANYKNMDKLIRLVNEKQKNGSNLNLFYSTPSCYLKALHDANISLSVIADDFFPYASDEQTYWTGCFTSRPTHKRLERLANNLLQVCKQLASLGNSTGELETLKLDAAREAQGILQHHDAITGTEKQAVADDYARIITEAAEGCGDVTRTAINNLVGGEGPGLQLRSCLQLNISQCEVSETDGSFFVTIYNPLSRPVSHYIRFPVSYRNYTVSQDNGTEVMCQLVPVPRSVLDLCYRNSKATMELVFRAEQIPPLGFVTYLVTPAGTPETSEVSEDNYVSNQEVIVEVDNSTGLVSNLRYRDTHVELSQHFHYYLPAEGEDPDVFYRTSGAYIFRPDPKQPLQNITDVVNTTVYKGPLVEEIHQIFSDWVSQVIRVYRDEAHVELEWQVGPIPDDTGKEVISRFSTDLASEEMFFTDSNGREMLRRRRNHRPTWELSLEELVSGNYYPVTTNIVVQDEERAVRMAVLTDRAQGGSSLQDGQLELMVHRRLLHDDSWGVGEALNETAFGQGVVARGKHYLLVGSTGSNTSSTDSTGITGSQQARERLLAQTIHMAPWVFFSSADNSSSSLQHHKPVVGLKQGLPRNVQVLTLEPWKEGSILLRLEHIMEKDDDVYLSEPVTVDLQDMFSTLTVVSARETTLDGNQWLEDNSRLQWLNHSLQSSPAGEQSAGAGNGLQVTLRPMQIRTFVLHIL